jgi:hypothetical protein
MPEENKWSTRRFDLIKGGILLGILLLLLIAFTRSPNVTSEEAEPTQAVATEVQGDTQPVSIAPIVNPPQTGEAGAVSFSGSAEP